MDTKTKTAIASAILAGGILYGGQAIHKTEIRNARMSLIDQREFTRNNPELCSVPAEFDPKWVVDDRCLTYEENLLLIKEMNKVKNVDTGKEVKSFEDKFDDKLLK